MDRAEQLHLTTVRAESEVLAAQGRRVEQVSLEEIDWLGRLRRGLEKTRRGFVTQLLERLGDDPLTPEVLDDLDIRPHRIAGTSIGAIVRNDEVIIGHDNVVVESDDHVILFLTDKRQVAAVERLFQVGLTFF